MEQSRETRERRNINPGPAVIVFLIVAVVLYGVYAFYSHILAGAHFM